MAVTVSTPELRRGTWTLQNWKEDWERFSVLKDHRQKPTMIFCLNEIKKRWELPAKATYWLEASRKPMPESYQFKLYRKGMRCEWHIPGWQLNDPTFHVSGGLCELLGQLGIAEGKSGVVYVRLRYRED